MTGKLPSLLLRLSIESLLLGPVEDPEPVILIRAIVSGLGDLRISSGRSWIGDEGADEVKGNDALLSGSGRLNGAGFDAGVTLGGGAGRR